MHAAQVMTEAGVQVAFKSDHPVLNAQHLIYEAQKANYYGLSNTLSFSSVTSVPAKILGINERVGCLEVGFDADIVIWENNGLKLGDTPLRVFVDGYTTFIHPRYAFAMAKKQVIVPEILVNTLYQKDLVCKSGSMGNVVLTNVSRIYADKNFTLNGSDLRVIIRNGKVVCMGEKCIPVASDLKINMERGVLIPGLVLAQTRLGLEEITAEQKTSNGVSKGYKEESECAKASDGLRVGLESSKVLRSAFHAGILSAVSVPRGDGVVVGQTVSWRLGENGIIIYNLLLI